MDEEQAQQEADVIESSVGDGREPGGISQEELGLLYRAAEIKVRALNEQVELRDGVIASWKGFGEALKELLGVEEIDAVIPAVRELKKNRAQRRAKPTRSSGTRSAGRKSG